MHADADFVVLRCYPGPPPAVAASTSWSRAVYYRRLTDVKVALLVAAIIVLKYT